MISQMCTRGAVLSASLPELPPFSSFAFVLCQIFPFSFKIRSALSPDTVNGQNGKVFFGFFFCEKTKCSNTAIDSTTKPTDILLHVMSISADAPSNLTYWDYLSQTHYALSLSSPVLVPGKTD